MIFVKFSCFIRQSGKRAATFFMLYLWFLYDISRCSIYNEHCFLFQNQTASVFMKAGSCLHMRISEILQTVCLGNCVIRALDQLNFLNSSLLPWSLCGVYERCHRYNKRLVRHLCFDSAFIERFGFIMASK